MNREQAKAEALKQIKLVNFLLEGRANMICKANHVNLKDVGLEKEDILVNEKYAQLEGVNKIYIPGKGELEIKQY